MGTTLTGTTPQDTYDSLIKVTDNGPLSGTAKYLSDGLGNDSALALSTAAVGIGTTSPSSPLDVVANNTTAIHLRLRGRAADSVGQMELWNNAQDVRYAYFAADSTSVGIATTQAIPLTFGTNTTERMRITSTGNVGIGTSAPNRNTEIVSGSGATLGVSTSASGSGILYGRLAMYSTFGSNSFIDYGGEIRSYSGAGIDRSDLRFYTAAGAASVEQARITSAGVLELTQGQIKFPATQVASADPNTLDDYEEGTWTMGVSFGGGTTGITYLAQTGQYTKIGRKVTVNGYLVLSNKGSDTGNALLTGLPFTIPNSQQYLSTASLWTNSVSFANQQQAVGKVNSTSVEFWETTEAGSASYLNDANFANNSEVIINFTYFV